MLFNKADILMIDGQITPIQERNLMGHFEQRVVDRFGVKKKSKKFFFKLKCFYF